MSFPRISKRGVSWSLFQGYNEAGLSYSSPKCGGLQGDADALCARAMKTAGEARAGKDRFEAPERTSTKLNRTSSCRAAAQVPVAADFGGGAGPERRPRRSRGSGFAGSSRLAGNSGLRLRDVDELLAKTEQEVAGLRAASTREVEFAGDRCGGACAASGGAPGVRLRP